MRPLLIADEPTGNLDPKNSLEVMQILEQINQRGITGYCIDSMTIHW